MDGDQSPAAIGSVGPPLSVLGADAASGCLQEETRKWRRTEQMENLEVWGKHLVVWFCAIHHCQRPWWFPLAPPVSEQQWCLPAEQWPELAPRPPPPERWSSVSRWSEQDPVRERLTVRWMYFSLKDTTWKMQCSVHHNVLFNCKCKHFPCSSKFCTWETTLRSQWTLGH